MDKDLLFPGPIGFAWPETDVVPKPRLLAAATGVRAHVGLSGRIQHHGWVLDYNFWASGRVRVGSRTNPWRERPAQVGHLYPPHTPYWEDSRSTDSRMNSAWIIFLHGEAAGLDRLTGPEGFAVLQDQKSILGPLLSEIAQTGQALGRAGIWKVQSLFHALIHELLRAEQLDNETFRVGGQEPPSLESEWVCTIRDFLKANLPRPLRLHDLARHAHVSLSTLSHQYKKETGESPMQTLTRLRIAVVKSLLLKGEPLKFIAIQTGFCDEYHLSKVFKKVEGCSPREFLKRIRMG